MDSISTDSTLEKAGHGHPRLHLLVGGSAAVVLASAFVWAPQTAQPFLAGGLVASALWCGWWMKTLEIQREERRWARLRKAWPWMGKPKRPSALMHTGLARWRRDITSLSSSVMGRHGKVVWEWAQAEWRAPYSARDREQGKEPPAPVKVWVLSLLLEDGSDLHWGHVHPVAWRHGSKLPPEIALSAGWPRWLALHAHDATPTLRAWNPVASERLKALPQDDLFSINSAGSCGCVVFPDAWLADGVLERTMPALMAALREATGPARWDAGVGRHWTPVL